MPNCTLKPNANGSFATGWGGTGTPAYSYTEIDEGTASPSTADFASCTADLAAGNYGLEDTPAGFYEATAATVKFYSANSSKGTPRKWNTFQVFAADGTTPLTSAGDVSGGSSSYSLLSVALTILVTDKTSWDGAIARITTNSGGSGFVYLAAFQVDMTYNEAPAGGPVRQMDYYQRRRAA